MSLKLKIRDNTFISELGISGIVEKPCKTKLLAAIDQPWLQMKIFLIWKLQLTRIRNDVTNDC
jgi:hypothetical protein